MPSRLCKFHGHFFFFFVHEYLSYSSTTIIIPLLLPTWTISHCERAGCGWRNLFLPSLLLKTSTECFQRFCWWLLLLLREVCVCQTEKERQEVYERVKRTRWTPIFSALDPALISEMALLPPIPLFCLSDHHGAVQPLLTELCCHGEELWEGPCQ